MMKRLAIISCFLFACIGVCATGAPAAPANGVTSASGKRRIVKKPAPRAYESGKVSFKLVAAKRRRRRHYYSRRYRYRGPLHPSHERVTEIQSALARSGYYKGDPNGKWDAKTISAMRNFQEDHGIDGTGKIDAISLQKLGLGSEIAGVDAPRRPVPQGPAPTGQASPAAVPGPGASVKPQTPQSPQAPKVPATGTGSGTGTPSAPGPSSATPQTSTDSSSSETTSLH